MVGASTEVNHSQAAARALSDRHDACRPIGGKAYAAVATRLTRTRTTTTGRILRLMELPLLGRTFSPAATMAAIIPPNQKSGTSTSKEEIPARERGISLLG